MAFEPFDGEWELPPHLIWAHPMFSIRSRRIGNSHPSKIRKII